MRTGPWLESAAAQDMRPSPLDQTRRGNNLLFAFDGTRTGHHHRRQTIAQPDLADPHLAGSRMKIAGNQFVGFTDMYHLQHSGQLKDR